MSNTTTSPDAALPKAALDFCDVSDLDRLISQGRKFGTILADPPWRYDNTASRGAVRNHYETMTVDEISALPIRQLASDDAHLHLWVTNAFLFEAPKIFKTWGFQFKSSFAWCKRKIGLGNYWRNAHELLLTAARGNATRFNDRSLFSWDMLAQGEHSEKPEEVRRYIERASPGPYLELFGRKVIPGWTVWGDEIARTDFGASLSLATDQRTETRRAICSLVP
jgi:N6-adenosine-specific RNA methylase IME4